MIHIHALWNLNPGAPPASKRLSYELELKEKLFFPHGTLCTDILKYIPVQANGALIHRPSHPKASELEGLSKWIWDEYCVPVYIEKNSTAVTAQHFLYSYCVPGKDFSVHTSFTTCYRDSTKPEHTLYTKERGKKQKRIDSEKKRFLKCVCWMSSQCQGH